MSKKETLMPPCGINDYWNQNRDTTKPPSQQPPYPTLTAAEEHEALQDLYENGFH